MRERYAYAKKVQDIKGLIHGVLLQNDILQLKEAATAHLRLFSLFRVVNAAQRLPTERVCDPRTPAPLPAGAVADAHEKGEGR